jgi:putative ABC transport system permease protein
MIPFLASRNLFRHPARSFLVILGIAISGGLLFDMAMLSTGLEESMKAIFKEIGYEIRVTPKGTLPFETEAALPNAHALWRELKTDPQIARAGPLLGTQLYLEQGGKPKPVFALGLDPEAKGLYYLRQGSDLTPEDTHYNEGKYDGPWKGEVVINPALAKEAGLKVGDSLALWGRSPGSLAPMAESRSFRITGIADFSFDLKGQRSIALHLSEAQDLSGARVDDRVSFFIVKTAPGVNAQELVERLKKAHPEAGVLSVADMVTLLKAQLAYFTQFANILGTVSLVVSFLLVAALLSLSVGERLGEIAMLRALGVTTGRTVALIVIEGFLLVLIATPLSLALGGFAAHYLDAILKAAPALPEELSFFVRTPGAIFKTIAILFSSGLVASIYPAYLASRMGVAETLHREVVG